MLGVPRRNLADCDILIVEDEFFIADDIARAVRRSGAEVVGPVSTLNGALALLRIRKIDAAIVDINLHGEMAYPLVDALEARGIPVALATGYGEEGIPDQYRHLPRWEKPYEVASLVQHLSEMLPHGCPEPRERARRHEVHPVA